MAKPFSTLVPVTKEGMRITLVISSLSTGGAERVLSSMANYWVTKGWCVTLLTMDDGRGHLAYDLHPAVRHYPLSVARTSSNPIQGIINNLVRIWVLRGAIKASTPQAVISFIDMTNVITLLSAFGLNIPVIVSERTDSAHHSIGKVWDILRKICYPYSSCLVTQTQKTLTYFSTAVRRRARVIPNPVALHPYGKGEIRAKEDIRGGVKTVMGMGRLSEEKGFDLLLRAFDRISAQHPTWYLVIWGEGHLRTSLERLRDKVELRERVHFPGRTKCPFEKMYQADLFVMSSHYEGFPNVLCEAMACGLPVVSFDCPSGPREIIRDEVDGILVPNGDVDALAAAMDRLMSSEKERKHLSFRAVEICERFSREKVMGMWEELLAELSNC
jgi:glycosyltransferase involved in cell wall biosynthesis